MQRSFVMIVAYLVTNSQNGATELFLSLSLAVLVNARLTSKTLILNVNSPQLLLRALLSCVCSCETGWLGSIARVRVEGFFFSSLPFSATT